jgi:hypothetical protein
MTTSQPDCFTAVTTLMMQIGASEDAKANDSALAQVSSLDEFFTLTL